MPRSSLAGKIVILLLLLAVVLFVFVGAAVPRGNDFHISVVANDRAEADRVFAALSDGGEVRMPIANAPWGPYFGRCADRFGVQWMVSLPHPA